MNHKDLLFFCPNCKRLSLIRLNQNQECTFCPRCYKILNFRNIHIPGTNDNSMKDKAKNFAKDSLSKILEYLDRPKGGG